MKFAQYLAWLWIGFGEDCLGELITRICLARRYGRLGCETKFFSNSGRCTFRSDPSRRDVLDLLAFLLSVLYLLPVGCAEESLVI